MKVSKMSVEYIDHMGSDLSVVNAARVSFDKQSEWERVLIHADDEHDILLGEPYVREEHRLSEKDAKLIAYLAKYNHWSPFAHTSVQLRIKAPIFVARQLVKHQVGGVWNEVSRRYVDSEPEFYFPEVWRGRPTDGAKQGSSGVVDIEQRWSGGEVSDPASTAVMESLDAYNALLSLGVAPEQARMVLPQNMQTEWIWTGSVMFFARVCKQRLDPHAQQESQEIAKLISDCVQPLFQASWAALTENQQQ